MDLDEVLEMVGKAVDVVGVLIIVVGIFVALAFFASRVLGEPTDDPYRTLRHSLGRAILLGLEFLVAGDIIRTVAISPTFRSAGVLGLIVLIRTFLSMSLEVEIEGMWPWHRHRRAQGRA